MLFNSYEFLIFFPIVLLVYFLLPKKIRWVWLLIASYYFYMCWNAKYAILLSASTFITYLSGILMDYIQKKTPEHSRQTLMKLCVAGSFLLNLGILAFFKYSGFLLDNISKFSSLLGISLHMPEFDILLPVGISFYIFQALSYTMDIYRGELYAEKNLLKYALFVSFFPQLVAGPIERSKNLLKQINQEHPFDRNNICQGFLIMMWGFFLKLVISDRVAIIVNTVYGNVDAYPGVYLIVATMLFAIQIYCDFAGYSLIAKGAAKMLGFDLMDNFNCPYLSQSVAEFWRRWHISLSTWFRDYLYIPLGGNRKGIFRQQLNIMIVFLTSGLWHGAQWSFILWGGLNGAFQVIGQWLRPIKKRLTAILHWKEDTLANTVVRIVITFILICFTWIFFRANRFLEGVQIVKSIVNAENWWVLFDGSLYQLGLSTKSFNLMLFAIGLLFLADLCKYNGIVIHQQILKQNLWLRWSVYILSILAVLVFGIYGPGYDASSFIYFQF